MLAALDQLVFLLGTLLIIPMIFGYLELHYRFPLFPFSRYFRREPEILVDTPHRINPGQKLPLVIIIKDANKFPVQLLSVSITIRSDSGNQIQHEIDYNRLINQFWFEDCRELDLGDLIGPIAITAKIDYSINGRRKSIVNHNVATSRPFPLLTYASDNPIPGSQNYWWGDLHYHSNYTEDFVEFGASLSATKTAARALGLDFVAITDHSYDLDNEWGQWTKNDPKLKKWELSRAEIQSQNEKDPPLLIPSEEVTVRNSKDRNVHLLVFNYAQFIPGSGDGAEKWFHHYSEQNIPDTLTQLDNNTLAIAAHPFAHTALLQWLLINRGAWETTDINHDELNGLQIINGYIQQRHVDRWVHHLLKGKHHFIYAGNDAHGNFNHFHQIKIPMLSTVHHQDQILGKWRTGVIKKGKLNLDNIMLQLRRGRCIVSNGPALDLQFESDDRQFTIGDEIHPSTGALKLISSSSTEFGALKNLTVYYGITGQVSEKILFSNSWQFNEYDSNIIVEDITCDLPGYLRAELTTNTDRRCLTNPIWITNG